MAKTLVERQTKHLFKWLDKAQVRTTILTVAFAVSALYCLAINTLSFSHLLTRAYPVDPLESALTVDAARVAAGTFNPAQTASGISTQTYSWISPYALSTAARFLPLDNRLGRYFSLACALATCLLLTFLFTKGQSPTFKIFAMATFVGVNTLSGDLFALLRMGTVAAFLSLLFVMAYYYGHSTKNHAWKIASCALLLLAICFKQSAASWALVPPLAVLFETRGRFTKAWTWSLVPVFVVTLYFAGMKVFAPGMFAASVANAQAFSLPIVSLFRMLWAVGRHSVLFTALVLVALVSTKQKSVYAPWLKATICILFISCAALAAKYPGGPNNFLGIYFAVAAFCVDSMRQYLDKPTTKWGIASALLVLWFLQTFPLGPTLNRYFTRIDHRQDHYAEAVRYVATLPGTVVSPEDPTITLFGRNTIEKDFFVEWGVRGHWNSLPADLSSYLTSADYIVDAHDWDGNDVLLPPMFASAGFKVDRDFGSYVVYRRTR